MCVFCAVHREGGGGVRVCAGARVSEREREGG